MCIRAILYDVGRDQGGKELFYKNMIIRMADYGYNMLMLNLEYRFHYPSHPEIAMPDSLTPEVIKRLDKVAKEYGIELVPFVNCAGHIDGIGMTDRYNFLSASANSDVRGVEQFRVNLPEAEEFMLDLYKDIYDCFSSKYFFIGGDEIRQLDLLYPELKPEERIREAFLYLNRIIANVKAQSKIPIISGDMIQKYPNVMDLLDKDVVVAMGGYFSTPATVPLSCKEYLLHFKRAGYKTVFLNSVCTFMGNPVLCDNSTMNIVFGTTEYNEIFGKEATGVCTTIWEIQYGSCFSIVWPWLYLQSCIHKGEERDCRSFEFLREYTTVEWGLPENDNSLEQWYQLVDIRFSQMVLYEAFLDQSMKPALERNGQRPYKMLRMLLAELFTSRNVLPELNAVRRDWLKPDVRNKMEQLYAEALPLAEGMVVRSIKRKEESRHLLQYNQVLLAVTDLVKLEEQLETAYHNAAQSQFTDKAAFQCFMDNMQEICLDMAECVDVLADWLKVLHTEENYAADACIMTPLAAEDLRKRAENIGKIAQGNVPLVQYQRFIRRDNDLPMMRHIRRWTDR